MNFNKEPGKKSKRNKKLGKKSKEKENEWKLKNTTS